MAQGKTLAQVTVATFATLTTRKETKEERERFKNGAGSNLPPELYALPKGSPERARMFAQAVGITPSK